MLPILLSLVLLGSGVSVAENPYNKKDGLSVQEILNVVQNAGFPEELIPEAVRIVLLESKGVPTQLQMKGGGGVGLFQIDLKVHWDKNKKNEGMRKWFSKKNIKTRKEAVKWLQDPNNNAEAALQIWNDRDSWDSSDSGWEAWASWNNEDIPKERQQEDWDIATNARDLVVELLQPKKESMEKEVLPVEEKIIEKTTEEITEVPMGTSEQRLEYSSQVPKEAGSYGLSQYKTLTGRKKKLSDNFAKLFQTIVGAE